MKKETFLHKLTNWLAALGFAAVCGCMAVVNNKVQKASAYTVQKAQESVIFSKEELNNCNYSYLCTEFVQTPTQENYDLIYGRFENSYIIYNNERYNFADYDNYNLSFIETNDEYYIYFNADNLGKWTKDNGTFLYGMTIYSSWFAENMQKSITLSASQLNTGTYEYFGTHVQYDDLHSYDYIIYNNNIYKYDATESENDGENLIFKNSNTKSINYSTAEYNWYYYESGNSNHSFNDSITIYSTYIADNINAPFTDGDDIIGGITSGLGLISYLATTFLNGFTGLFWQNNALTNFAMYSLIMLGIAITFSIIKLVLNILRTNTGA